MLQLLLVEVLAKTAFVPDEYPSRKGFAKNSIIKKKTSSATSSPRFSWWWPAMIPKASAMEWLKLLKILSGMERERRESLFQPPWSPHQSGMQQIPFSATDSRLHRLWLRQQENLPAQPVLWSRGCSKKDWRRWRRYHLAHSRLWQEPDDDLVSQVDSWKCAG